MFIPIKPGAKLGESKSIALRRFHQLERRLQANSAFRDTMYQNASNAKDMRMQQQTK